MAQPYYDQAYGQALQASSPITGGTVSNYLNPYTDWVTKNLNEVFGKQMRDVTGGLTQAAGGVGADRIGVAQSELGRQQGLAAGQTYSDIYNRALQAAQTDASRGLQGAGLISNLGTTAQNSMLQGLQALLGTGGQQQQLSQSQLQALWNQLASQFSFGFQRPQYEAGVLGSLAPAAGGTSQGTSVTQYPPPSMLSQILGGITGGIGLAGGAGAFGGSGGSKGSTPSGGYGYNLASPANYGSSPTFQNGMYVPTFPANRGGRINRRYADGGATADKPPASFMDYFNNMFGVGDGQQKLQGFIGDQIGGLMDSLQPGALISGLAKGEFPKSGLLGMMQSGQAPGMFSLLGGRAAGGPVTSAIGSNPFETSDIGSFDAPLQPRPTQFPKLDIQHQKMPGDDKQSSGPGIGDAVKIAAQILPMMINRGGAVVNAYQGYDDGGSVPFEERFPNPSYALDASGMPSSRGPIMPSISGAARLRDALTNRGIPAASMRQLQRMLNSFDSGGNVEPLRMSEEKMADALHRLKNAGLLNPSAAKDFAAARYQRMGIDPRQAVGAPAKYAFGGEAGQSFGDFDPYDSTTFNPNLNPYGGDIELPADNSLGLGKKPNWSPAQSAAPALIGAGATNKDIIDADEAGGDAGGDTTTFSGKAYDDSGAFRKFVNTPYPGPTQMPGGKMPYPDATSRGGFGNEFPRSPWEALARAGFATMAGTSPYAGVNIGHGALEGLKTLDEQRKAKMNEVEVNQRAQGLWQQMQQHADQYKYMTPAQKLNAIQQERLYRKQIEQLELEGLKPFIIDKTYDEDTGVEKTTYGIRDRRSGEMVPIKIDPNTGKLVRTDGKPLGAGDTGEDTAPTTQPTLEEKKAPIIDEFKKRDEAEPDPLGTKELRPDLVPSVSKVQGPAKGPMATQNAQTVRKIDDDMTKKRTSLEVQRDQLTRLKQSYATVMTDNDKDGFFTRLMTLPGADPEARIDAAKKANLVATAAGKPAIFNPQKIAAIEEAIKIQKTMGMSFAATISPRDAMQMQLASISAQPGFTQSPMGMLRLMGLYDGLVTHSENEQKFWGRWKQVNPRSSAGWEEDFRSKNPSDRTTVRAMLNNIPNQAAKQRLSEAVQFLRDHKDDPEEVKKFDQIYSGTSSFFLTGRFDPYAGLK